MTPLLVLGMVISLPLHAASDWRSLVYNWGSSLKTAAPSREAIVQKTADFYKQAKELTNYKSIIGVSAVILGALWVAWKFKLFSDGKSKRITQIVRNINQQFPRYTPYLILEFNKLALCKKLDQNDISGLGKCITQNASNEKIGGWLYKLLEEEGAGENNQNLTDLLSNLADVWIELAGL